MSFTLDMEKFIAKTEGKAEKIVRGTAIALFADVIMLTPVGNPSMWKTKYPPKGYVGGRLRGNWQANLNRPKAGQLEAKDKAGTVTVNKAASTVNQLKMGDSVYLTNNLPYAQAIEDGRTISGGSLQAPAGMVKINVARFQREIDKQVNKFK